MDGRITRLLNASPLPVVIVIGQAPPPSLNRVVVGVTGTTVSRSAEELAAGLCERDGAELLLAHFSPAYETRTTPERASLHALSEGAPHPGIRMRRIERETTGPVARALADLTAEYDADLLVVGARLRRLDGRPFLGHTIQEILHHHTVKTMAIVALPDPFPTPAESTARAQEGVRRP